MTHCDKISCWGGQQLKGTTSRSTFIEELRSTVFKTEECNDSRTPAKTVPKGTTGMVIHEKFLSGDLSVTILGPRGEVMQEWKEHPFSLEEGAVRYIHRGTAGVVVSQLKRNYQGQINQAAVERNTTSWMDGVGDYGVLARYPRPTSVPAHQQLLPFSSVNAQIPYQIPVAMGYGVPATENDTAGGVSLSQLSGYQYM